MSSAAESTVRKFRGKLDDEKLESLIEERIQVYEIYDGQRVKALRDQLGLSVRDFAQWSGVSTTSIYAWQSRKRNPSHLACRALYQLEAYFFPTKFGKKTIF